VDACASCGRENPADAKFCNGCGASLLGGCPGCGRANPPDARFCSECGTALGGAPVAAPAARQAERRLVSVLFADLVGFTALSESRDAEEVRELLSRYFDTCRRLIELYGGTVEKFIGDAVMAVWGTPAATEDDAERAVRAGLDLVAAVSALGEELGDEELRARAGVLTGEAAVDLAAVGEGMVAGDLVNTASRVQSVAEPGSVLVGEATRRASERAVVYEPAGTFALKGKEGETPLWRALRVVSGVGGMLRSEGLEAPFVGREHDLERLKQLFHACERERRPHLVSVTGIAGIGKSRLAWEFYKYFDGIVGRVFWHRGRCLAYGEGVSYWALADMVRMRCRIAEDDDPEAALTKLRSTLDEYVLDLDERRFAQPRLALLLGVGELESADRQELYAAWRLFFERLADVNPVLLVFEDLQWADTGLLDFVEHLLGWARDRPIFVLTLARPELAERRPSWGAGLRSFTSLHLEPLPEEAMRRLLGGLVPGLPPDVTDSILGAAEGVPLYAVETVRMLLDRGLLVEDGPAYRVAGEVESLAVPETLHALIAARLDGLAADERRLLQNAAVLGKTFSRHALAALSGLPEPRLEELLAGLVRKEVLFLQADPRSPERGQYGFLQDLLRRVAYETLPRRERAALHSAAAEQIAAALGADEAAELVASHLLEAHRAAPGGESQARAAAALVQAGERAASLAAAVDAQRWFEQAAGLAEDPLEHAQITRRAGAMAWKAGDSTAAQRLLEQARAAFAELGEPRLAARTDAVLAEVDFESGQVAGAVERLRPALAALESNEPGADVAALAAQLGRFLFLAARYDEALPLLERALELAETLWLPETLVQALNSKASILGRQGRRHEGGVLMRAALDLALAHDLHDPALRAYNNLLVDLWTSDRWPETAAMLEVALELAQRVGDRRWETNFLAGSTISLYMGGDWDLSLARAAEVERRGPTEFALDMAVAGTVFVLCGRGRLAEAREVRERNCPPTRENPDYDAFLAVIDAVLLRNGGAAREALAQGTRATAIFEETGAGPFHLAVVEALEAAAAVGEAELRAQLAAVEALAPTELSGLLRAQLSRFRARVEPARAGVLYEEAEGLLAEAELPFHLAVVRLEHARWLAAEGREADAGPRLADARRTFERLGATPWLEQAEALAPASRSGEDEAVAVNRLHAGRP
jgi:class 3 adenylate cyclase/tetratricopeptide (TPR) repeat protein